MSNFFPTHYDIDLHAFRVMIKQIINVKVPLLSTIKFMDACREHVTIHVNCLFTCQIVNQI